MSLDAMYPETDEPVYQGANTHHDDEPEDDDAEEFHDLGFKFTAPTEAMERTYGKVGAAEMAQADAVIAATSEYEAADRAGREAMWAGFTDQQRATLAGFASIAGPVDVDVDEDEFEFVDPDDEDFDVFADQFLVAAKTGLGRIRKGDLSVTEDLATRIADLYEFAVRRPPDNPEGAEALQRAVHLLGAANDAALANIPFGAGGPVRTQPGTNAAGQAYVRETDVYGRERRTITSAQEIATTAKASQPQKLPDPKTVTPEDLAAMDQKTFVRYEKEYPGAVEAILRQHSA